MSIYVLDTERLDKTKPPRNVRVERVVVIGHVDAVSDGVSVDAIYAYGKPGPEDLGQWCAAERLALYENVRKADAVARHVGVDWKRENTPPGGRVL